jgi:hypothetical protein
MNDAGLVVGVTFDWELNIPSAVVAWDALEPPTPLGIGGIRRVDGSSVYGHAVDVNESGVIAAQRTSYGPAGRMRSTAAFLWDEVNGKTRLPTPAQRPWGEVAAINDQGVAVGDVRRRGEPSLPVYWRNGQLKKLPLPPGATSGYALDINNRGLIVGAVSGDKWGQLWWWRRNARHGSLSLGGLKATPWPVSIDDHDRIVGSHERRLSGYRDFMWREPRARPRHILGGDGGVAAMDNSRHLVGADGGFRGISDRAWIARHGDPGVTTLPDPPMEDPDDWLVNTFAEDIATGITPFAPDGGLTVGGYAEHEIEPTRAVLWTCAQTYLTK